MINFTDNKPTRPGAYWFRYPEGDTFLLHVVQRTRGNKDGLHLYASGDCLRGWVDNLSGQWSGRLVPVGEVRKAWFEGARAGATYEAGINSGESRESLEEMYAEGHARRVVEGEE